MEIIIGLMIICGCLVIGISLRDIANAIKGLTRELKELKR